MKEINAVACVGVLLLIGCGGGSSSPDTTQGAAQAAVQLQSSQLNNYLIYQTDETISDGTANSYRTRVALPSSATGAFDDLIYDSNNVLVSKESYDQNRELSDVTIYNPDGSVNRTCSYSIPLKNLPNPLTIGETVRNKTTETCTNGFSYAVDETSTFDHAETITANNISYNTLIRKTEGNIVTTVAATNAAYPHSVLANRYIDRNTGYFVKEIVSYTYTTAPPAPYVTAYTKTLISHTVLAQTAGISSPAQSSTAAHQQSDRLSKKGGNNGNVRFSVDTDGRHGLNLINKVVKTNIKIG